MKRNTPLHSLTPNRSKKELVTILIRNSTRKRNNSNYLCNFQNMKMKNVKSVRNKHFDSTQYNSRISASMLKHIKSRAKIYETLSNCKLKIVSSSKRQSRMKSILNTIGQNIIKVEKYHGSTSSVIRTLNFNGNLPADKTQSKFKPNKFQFQTHNNSCFQSKAPSPNQSQNFEKNSKISMVIPNKKHNLNLNKEMSEEQKSKIIYKDNNAENIFALMDDIKLNFSNNPNYTFKTYPKKESNCFYLKITYKNENSLSDELFLYYDEEKKLKLKIFDPIDFTSKFNIIDSITKKYLAVDHLYIKFEKIDEPIIKTFISEFNLFEPFTSSTNTLKTIELNFDDCSPQNQNNHDISKIYNWKDLNKLQGPADRHKIIRIKDWNLGELNNLNELIKISNSLEFYLLNCKLNINNDTDVSFYVNDKSVKMITDKLSCLECEYLNKGTTLGFSNYDIKIAKSFIQEYYVLYMDFLNAEDKKFNIRTKVINACTHALENYLIDKENNFQFDFCSIKVVLECPDKSIKNIENLFEEYKNNKLPPKFYGEEIKEENKRRRRSQKQSEAFSKCKIEISNQYITPSNLVIILSLGTIVNEMRFNNCTLVLQSYDDLNQYLNFGGQINLKNIWFNNIKFLLFKNSINDKGFSESYTLNNLTEDNSCEYLYDLLFKTKLTNNLENICIVDSSNTFSNKLKEQVEKYNRSNCSKCNILVAKSEKKINEALKNSISINKPNKLNKYKGKMTSKVYDYKNSFSLHSESLCINNDFILQEKFYNRYESSITKRKVFRFKTKLQSRNTKDFQEMLFKPLDYNKLKKLFKGYIYLITSSEENGNLALAYINVWTKPINLNLSSKDSENKAQENDPIEDIDKSCTPHAKILRSNIDFEIFEKENQNEYILKACLNSSSVEINFANLDEIFDLKPILEEISFATNLKLTNMCCISQSTLNLLEMMLPKSKNDENKSLKFHDVERLITEHRCKPKKISEEKITEFVEKYQDKLNMMNISDLSNLSQTKNIDFQTNLKHLETIKENSQSYFIKISKIYNGKKSTNQTINDPEDCEEFDHFAEKFNKNPNKYKNCKLEVNYHRSEVGSGEETKK